MRNTPGLLMLSALLGISLWVFVTEEENPTRVEELGNLVLVQSVNVEPGFALANQLESVQLTLAAPEERWAEIEANLASFSAFVDLRGVMEREQEIRVQVDIEGVRGVRVIEVFPERVTVNLEDLISAKVPVRVRPIGPLPLGFEQGDTSVDLPSVTVTGPESLVCRVRDAVADVNITGLTLGIEPTVVLIPRGVGGGEIRGVTLEPAAARVSVDIRQSTLVRTLPLQVDPKGAPAPGYHITNVVVSPSTITVEGTLEALQQLGAINLGEVDVTAAQIDVTRAFQVELPQGISADETRSITVIVQISPIEGDFTVALVAGVVGLANGLATALDTETIEVTLTGSLPLLSQFIAGDVAVTLDVTGLGVGIHDIAVEVTVPEGAALQSLHPETVSVTLIIE